MALTATAPADVKKTVAESLAMGSFVSISASPNRPNIKLIVVDLPKKKPYACPDAMDWLINRVKTLGPDTPRVIVYCRTHVQCHSLYGLFDEQVDDSELFAMYHGSTHPDVQKKVVDDFENANGKIRVLFATIAFGMGIDAKGVHTIIHLGVPCDVDDYVQESGRCGRDGRQSVSILIKYPGMYAGTQTSARMKAFAANSTECRRKLILREFEPGEAFDIPAHLCCDICAGKCSPSVACAEEANVLAFFGFQPFEVNYQRRVVNAQLRGELDKRLTAYRLSLLENHDPQARFLAGKDLATGIPSCYLNDIVLECDVIYPDVEAFQKRYPFYDIHQASVIWGIVNEVLCSCPVYDIDLEDYYGHSDNVDPVSENESEETESKSDISDNNESDSSSRSIDSDLYSDDELED